MANLHQLAEYRGAQPFISLTNVQNALAALGGEAHLAAITSLVTGSIQPRVPKTAAVQVIDSILRDHSAGARSSFRRVFGPDSHRWAFAHDRIKDDVIRKQNRAVG